MTGIASITLHVELRSNVSLVHHFAEGMGVRVSKMTDSSGFFENGQGSRRRAVHRVSER